MLASAIARALLLLAVITFAGTMLFAPRIAQDERYHDFADKRELVRGIPNTLNVLSNVPFLIAAVIGFATIRRERFRSDAERVDAIVFFAGIALTAIGSTIYHWSPSDATLPWDRLGMTVGFMAFLAMLAHEHLSAGNALLPALLAIGVASIWWWESFGDLRPYGWVQFFPMIAIVAIAVFGLPVYSGERGTLVAVFVCYGAAKFFEAADRRVFAALGGTVSGHTLKHVAAALAPVAIAMWIRRRRALPEFRAAQLRGDAAA